MKRHQSEFTDPVRASALLALALLTALSAWHFLFSPRKAGRNSADAVESSSPPTETVPPVTASEPRAVPTKPKPVSASTVAPVMDLPPPSAYTRQFLTNLLWLDSRQREVTPEMAAWWRGQLAALKKAGPDGVAAIREFLAQNQDLSFDRIPSKAKPGFPSLRTALIDALGDLGGPAAVETALEVLRTTALPAEIGQLAQTLEKLAPDQYHREFLDAARAVLAQAQAGQLPGYDVGSLFQILSQYGGADAAADLKKAGNWKFYSAIALGNLPDATGLPALIELARDDNPQNALAAWPIVAEFAAKSDQANAALLEAARDGTLAAEAWGRVALALGGYEFHIAAAPATLSADISLRDSHGWHYFGLEQNFSAVINVAALSNAEISARIGLIDQLATLNPPSEAKNSLLSGRERLLNELERRRNQSRAG